MNHTMKTYGKVKVWLHLATRRRWVVSFTPWLLYPRRKIPQYSVWDPEPVWTQWRREEIPSPSEIKPPVIKPIAQLLYRLNYPGDFILVKVFISCPSALTKHHAMKAYWDSGGIALRILWPRH